MEGERRLRPLVLVHAVTVQAVTAAAGPGIVEGQAKVIPAQEPLEGTSGFLRPRGVLGGTERFQAGRNH